MKKRVLIVYPNCSMGGMATVYKNRALSQPHTEFDFVFTKDLGGKSFFSGLENVQINIVRPDRLINYLKYLVKVKNFDSVFLTSLPNAFNAISDRNDNVCYEFHSSSESVLRKEISEIEFTKLRTIITPSAFLKDMLSGLVPDGITDRIRVVPNIVDHGLFNLENSNPRYLDFSGKVPLVWIGRLDSGKNVNDFIRLLSLIDDSFLGVVVLGLEQDPKRYANFIGYASSLGVLSKIKTLVNLPQDGVAELLAATRDCGGSFVSTSLGESFGFGVQEALDAGVDTVAYNVGALAERSSQNHKSTYTLVDVGDIREMALTIQRQTNSVAAK